MRCSFRFMAMIAFFPLLLALTACGSLSEKAVQSVDQPPSIQSATDLNLEKIQNERLRLEQNLADYEKQLDQIWKNVEI